MNLPCIVQIDSFNALLSHLFTDPSADPFRDKHLSSCSDFVCENGEGVLEEASEYSLLY